MDITNRPSNDSQTLQSAGLTRRQVEDKLRTVGYTDIVVYDKTGTLTDDAMEGLRS